MNCVFCKIIEGTIPSYKIYEDDLVISILDIKPISNGHLLIIPKNHYRDLFDLPIEISNHINKISEKMYELLEKKLNIKGAAITNNIGNAQEIKHFHIHIIPSKDNEELKKVEEIYKMLKINK